MGVLSQSCGQSRIGPTRKVAHPNLNFSRIPCLEPRSHRLNGDLLAVADLSLTQGQGVSIDMKDIKLGQRVLSKQ